MLWRLEEGGEEMGIFIVVIGPERENEPLVGSKRQKNHNQIESHPLPKIQVKGWFWFFKSRVLMSIYLILCKAFILSGVMSIPKCPFSKKKTHLWRER